MSSQRLTKAAVVMGGFLIFVGMVIMGIFVLVLLGAIDVGVLESQGYRILIPEMLLVVGALDLVSGIVLRRE